MLGLLRRLIAPRPVPPLDGQMRSEQKDRAAYLTRDPDGRWVVRAGWVLRETFCADYLRWKTGYRIPSLRTPHAVREATFADHAPALAYYHACLDSPRAVNPPGQMSAAARLTSVQSTPSK